MEIKIANDNHLFSLKKSKIYKINLSIDIQSQF